MHNFLVLCGLKTLIVILHIRSLIAFLYCPLPLLITYTRPLFKGFVFHVIISGNDN